MEVLQVSSELGRIDPVPVKGDEIDSAITTACSKEVLQPGLSRWRTRRCRGPQSDTLRLERLHISLPEFHTLLRSQI